MWVSWPKPGILVSTRILPRHLHAMCAKCLDQGSGALKMVASVTGGCGEGRKNRLLVWAVYGEAGGVYIRMSQAMDVPKNYRMLSN